MRAAARSLRRFRLPPLAAFAAACYAPQYMQQQTHIFVVGWARSGTTSLAAALRRLGWPTLGQRTDLVAAAVRADLRPILPLLQTPIACHDWPWPLLTAQLALQFPAARFVLTTREPAGWLASYRALLRREGRLQRWRMARVRRLIYGADPFHLSDRALLDRVERHQQAVRAQFAGTTQRLLECDLTRGDGWPQLCSFLNVPLPATAFPHLNRTDVPCASC